MQLSKDLSVVPDDPKQRQTITCTLSQQQQQK